jgi:D-serine deaminase-like pyridoxal phosphate-dependent protein
MNHNIEKPTLILNVNQVQRNIKRMAEKAQRQDVRFRPHFKTHQSATIGEWFRLVGVTAITVSSVEMAQYFAHYGWDDITIAFPVNLRQIDTINTLARSIHLGLLLDSVETAQILSSQINAQVDVWIEIDDGTNRTGIIWDHPEAVLQLAAALKTINQVQIKGLLTHAGRIYRAGSPADITHIYTETVDRMNLVRQYLAEQGFTLEISVGDTPGCTLCSDLGSVDEIRPGNFVFFDTQQMAMGVCNPRDIAAIVACPVVAKYPQRGEIAIYGGAVHLSKDTVQIEGQNVFGLAASLKSDPTSSQNQPWISVIKGGFVNRLSQEHGMVTLPATVINRITIGDLLYVIPAHICLAVSALGEYCTTDGRIIKTMNHNTIIEELQSSK